MGKQKRNQAPKETYKQKVSDKRDTTKLEPKNALQRDYINAIKHSNVVICTGVWGSAKTYIPSVLACDMLLKKEVEKVVIARPAEGKGKSVGFFKGDKDEKLSGWVAPITDTMKKRLGESHFEYLLDRGKIELIALEQIKGRSWDDAFIIIDEAEDLDPSVAKSLVGRQGIRSKTVITGDIAQQDLKETSGLQILIKVAEDYGLNVPHIDFNSWDYCVRSEEAKEWGKAFEKYEKIHGLVK